MPEYFHRQFLSRFGAAGRVCTCGREHPLGVRDILMGSGALQESARLARSRYPQALIWVLSDENTETAAAAAWKQAAGGRIISRILPRHPRPLPTMELVDSLTGEARAAGPGLIVAVGSGVISDLGKMVSRGIGIPNWSMATAPSVDAYASATAAIRVKGYGRSLPAGITEVIACDLDVIRRAPAVMFLAGLGDLIAKFPAYLDWQLSHLMTGEYYCAEVEEFALLSARTALAAAREREADPDAAASTLMDAALVSSLAMQAVRGSRPASSAEHAIAHFWEMSFAVGREELDLHGILVGAASRLVLGGIRGFYRDLSGFRVDPRRRQEALSREPRWEDRAGDAMRPFWHRMQEEMAGHAFGPGELKQRLEAFERERERISMVAAEAVGELASGVETLQGMSYPFSLDALEVSRDLRFLPVRNIRFLRNRYSTFTLAYELGKEEELASAVINQAV
jgi:glycerol-1-phosphate dehydrogenase [NAD(P)+]